MSKYGLLGQNIPSRQAQCSLPSRKIDGQNLCMISPQKYVQVLSPWWLEAEPIFSYSPFYESVDLRDDNIPPFTGLEEMYP